MRRGDTVRLQSGGTKMTIFGIVEELPDTTKEQLMNSGAEEKDVVCKWFVGTTLKKEIFKPEMLMRA
ncbi:DUF2158 domain-containing protein [Pleionea sediminis]|uniref:DUF2158 domain-containing protein n=1 Tax=Pleionea sediminis TaxID=2569479 RepID=UPI0013DDA460|nr:DUF2158 domain-containing protein [Pleionea sediminis]